MRYLIKLMSTRYRSDNNRFAIFVATQINDSAQSDGLAYIVFKNTIPLNDEGYLEIWGDWIESERYGQQFAVRSWIHHDTPPQPELAENSEDRSSEHNENPEC